MIAPVDGIGFLTGVQTDRAESRVRSELHDPPYDTWSNIAKSTRHEARAASARWPGRAHRRSALAVEARRASPLPRGRRRAAGVRRRRRHASRRSRSSRRRRRTSSCAGWRSLQRRLLWRVRRKLIISYIFIGFVPAILIVAFFLLGGAAAVLELQLVPRADTASRADRPRRVDRHDDRARDPARRRPRRGRRSSTQRAGRRRARVPGRSMAVVPMRPPVRAPAATGRRPGAAAERRRRHRGRRPWAHVDAADGRARRGSAATASRAARLSRAAERPHGGAGDRPPTDVAGSAARRCRADSLIRALAFPDRRTPGYAVVVDLPVNDRVTPQLRDETGVELTGVAARPSGRRRALPAAGGAGRRRRRSRGERSAAAHARTASSSTATGRRARPGTLRRLDAAEHRRRSTTGISAAQGVSAAQLRPGAAAHPGHRSASCS